MGSINFNPNMSGILVDARIFGNSTSHSQSHNSVDYRDVRLVLDTGASKTLIIPNAILGLGYDLSNPKYIELVTTASGIIDCPILTVSNLSCIGELVSNLDIIIQDLPDELTKYNIQGLLGLDFLRQFDISISFSAGLIIINRFNKIKI